MCKFENVYNDDTFIRAINISVKYHKYDGRKHL